MPLDSWIDDDAVAMLRALSPQIPEPTPFGERDGLEMDGLFEGITTPATVILVPSANPAFPPVAPSGVGQSGESPGPAPVPDVPLIVRNEDPAPEAIARLRQTLAAIRRRAEQDGVVRVAPASPAPLPPAAVVDDAATRGDAGITNSIPAGMVATIPPPAPDFPHAPLAVRLAVLCGWLDSRFGLASAMVMDRHGCPLHGGATDGRLAAAAYSRGQAWRHGGARQSPGDVAQAIHAAWDNAIMVVVPVPTRFGDLFAAGIVRDALNPAAAASIAGAVRRCAGIDG